MTWKEMSLDCREAARELVIVGRYRSAISRAYYAAYCAVTSVLEGQVDFAHAGNNPTHDALDALILNNLYHVPKWERLFLMKTVRRLRVARVGADYGPGEPAGRNEAVEAIRAMLTVTNRLLGE